MIGWLLIISGILLFPIGLYFGGLWNKKGLSITFIGIFSLTTGLTTMIDELPADQSALGVMNNPYPDNKESRERGYSLYISNCLSCHGKTGMLTINLHEHAMHHEGNILFDYISNGIIDGSMPAFNNKLSNDQIWHVINYIKSMEGSPMGDVLD
tara:strand:+ start:509 stop:970 length:462 start_codon:yes stop_codon:yes gene_type:complete